MVNMSANFQSPIIKTRQRFEYTEARVSKISKWSLNTSKGLNDEDS